MCYKAHCSPMENSQPHNGGNCVQVSYVFWDLSFQLDLISPVKICVIKYLKFLQLYDQLNFHQLGNFCLCYCFSYITDSILLHSYVKVLRMDFPWENYMKTKLITGTPVQLLRQYEKKSQKLKGHSCLKM